MVNPRDKAENAEEEEDTCYLKHCSIVATV